MVFGELVLGMLGVVIKEDVGIDVGSSSSGVMDDMDNVVSSRVVSISVSLSVLLCEVGNVVIVVYRAEVFGTIVTGSAKYT